MPDFCEIRSKENYGGRVFVYEFTKIEFLDLFPKNVPSLLGIDFVMKGRYLCKDLRGARKKGETAPRYVVPS
jgi:hypothetical protein